MIIYATDGAGRQYRAEVTSETSYDTAISFADKHGEQQATYVDHTITVTREVGVGFYTCQVSDDPADTLDAINQRITELIERDGRGA